MNTASLSALSYVLHAIDSRWEAPWESKAAVLLYTELVINFLKVLLYIGFVAVMVRIYTLPLFAFRPMYETMRKFAKMVQNYKKKETKCIIINEENMSAPVKDILEGKLSYRKAADKYNIKASTLESRVKKIEDKPDDDVTSRIKYQSKYTSYQIFSREEES